MKWKRFKMNHLSITTISYHYLKIMLHVVQLLDCNGLGQCTTEEEIVYINTMMNIKILKK